MFIRRGRIWCLMSSKLETAESQHRRVCKPINPLTPRYQDQGEVTPTMLLMSTQSNILQTVNAKRQKAEVDVEQKQAKTISIKVIPPEKTNAEVNRN